MISAELIENGAALFSETFEYEILGMATFNPDITIAKGQLQLTFQNDLKGEICHHDLNKKRLATSSKNERTVSLNCKKYGIYIINVIVAGNRWSKKIQGLE